MLPFPNRLQLLIPLIIFGFIVFQLDLLFRFQHGAEALDQSQVRKMVIDAAIKHMPTGFTFLPPITSNLPSKNAVITLLSGPQLHDEKAYAFDKYCEEALYQAYSFLHSPATKLGSDSETEFVVMMTPGQTSQCRSALLELGARVIVVPILSMTELDYSHRYHYTYTKYQMWALEGIYEKILYIDLDLLFVTKSPIPLFSFIDQFHASNNMSTKENFFYGGVEDWNPQFLTDFGCSVDHFTGCINGGLLLLEPNLIDYKRLQEKMKTTRSAMADQYTLQQYFDYKGPRAPVLLPKIYNTMWSEQGRTEQEVADAVGFHFKTFDPDSNLYTYPHPHVISHIWKHLPNQLLQLRRIQMDIFAAGKHLPIIPVALNNHSDTHFVHALRTKYDRVTILAPLGGSDESLLSREEFAKRLHQSFLETARPMGLIDTFRLIAGILDKYEWVWVVHPALRLIADSRWPVHVLLDKLTSEKMDAMVLAFDDCNGRSGSFFISKSAKPVLAQFVANIRVDKEVLDAEVWARFWSLVKTEAVVAAESEKLYLLDANMCTEEYFQISNN